MNNAPQGAFFYETNPEDNHPAECASVGVLCLDFQEA